jgi:hypothetical protein
VYVVQNFSLRRKVDDRHLTCDEYLDESLKIDNKEDERAKRAIIRRRIKERFTQRRCFTVPSPVRDNRKLRHLSQLNDEEMCRSYRSELEEIRLFLLSSAMEGSLLRGEGKTIMVVAPCEKCTACRRPGHTLPAPLGLRHIVCYRVYGDFSPPPATNRKDKNLTGVFRQPGGSLRVVLGG